MAKSQFIVRGGADFSGIQREMTKTEKGLKGFEGRINGMFGGVAKGLGINLGALTKIGLIAAATKAFYEFGKQAVAVASDLREVQNVVDVTFGSMAQDVNDFAGGALKQFGLSELSAKQYTSTMGAMLKSSGISGDAVRDMSIEVAKLTADMASFYNLEGDVAFQKIRSGLSGETEPLKQLGINMSVANMEAYAMSQGINKAWREMTQAEQTMLRYNYLLSVTGDAQGDFAREAGTWANQVKILKEQWQEFMGLIGTALIEVLTPFIKGLNKLLEIVINVVREIGKMYTMMTGREVIVESTTNLSDANADVADTAGDAADGQNDLAKGIGKAAKAAKGALAPFDELNILQTNLGGGGGSGGSGTGGLFDGLNSGGTGTTSTTMFSKQVDDGPDTSKWEAFFIWFGDKWNSLKQMLSVPIMVPAPVFAAIPSPVYSPEWNLTPPFVPKPVFQPIPNPVYKPQWGLELPPIQQVVFPPIESTQYQYSLQAIKLKTTEAYQGLKSSALESLYALQAQSLLVWEGIRTGTELKLGEINTGLSAAWNAIESNFGVHKENMGVAYEGLKSSALESLYTLQTQSLLIWEGIRTGTELKLGEISTGLSTAWSTVESNLEAHKENVGLISAAIASVLSTNLAIGWSKAGENANSVIATLQTNLNTFGVGVGAIAGSIATAFVTNLNNGLSKAESNFAEWANELNTNLRTWGSGVLEIIGETSKGMVSNFVSGLQTMWNNFKSYMAAIGERVSGFYKENKEVIITTAVVGGAIIGAGLALSNPVTAPFAAPALGALATIPALAKGGITNGPTLAMIGDNPGGKEVVSPLDDLTNIIASAVGTAVMNAVQFGGSDSGGNQEVNIHLDGTKLGRVMLPKLNQEADRLGYKPILQYE